eukprot:gb/GFBE01043412.1/.p1 GENE.gb/GFBE01043412.1/~~gb/GFBE01043412.1/.p1  ORF type:complete len:883 (+),score=182.92 gb/GFBE01043412.1/:1-2649(+)
MIKATTIFLVLLVLPQCSALDGPRVPSGSGRSALEVESGGNLIRRQVPLGSVSDLAAVDSIHGLARADQDPEGSDSDVIGGQVVDPEDSDLERMSQELKEGIDALDSSRQEKCCTEQTAKCLACLAGKSLQDFCSESPARSEVEGCQSDVETTTTNQASTTESVTASPSSIDSTTADATAGCSTAIQACEVKVAEGAKAQATDSEVDACASAQALASCIWQASCCEEAAAVMKEKLPSGCTNFTDPCLASDLISEEPGKQPGEIPEIPGGETVQPTAAPEWASQADRCQDQAVAPQGGWVIYNSSDTVPAACTGLEDWSAAPDVCCEAPAAVREAAPSFRDLYASVNGNRSCPVMPDVGLFVNKQIKLQCNADRTITFGEGLCEADCSGCAHERFLEIGCFKSKDLAGMTTFLKSEGCDCPPSASGTVMLMGDYDTMIGDDKEKFLSQCSALLETAANCVDVQPGSILLTLGAKSQALLDEAIAFIRERGLNMDNFKNFTVDTAWMDRAKQPSTSDFLWSEESKDCLDLDSAFAPLDMAGTNRSLEVNYMKCRDRCETVRGCAHWSYYLNNGGCHLQDASAEWVDVPNVLTGIPHCKERDPYNDTNTPKAGDQHCYRMSVAWIPLDLPNTTRFRESSYTGCQARCMEEKDCSAFTYFIASQGCHLEGKHAHLVWLPGTISGHSFCNSTDKDKFDSYLKTLSPDVEARPNMIGKTVTACEDAVTPFVLSDLDDLDEPGDLSVNSELTCAALAQHHHRAEICVYSEKVKERCPKLCGKCDIVPDDGGCLDGGKDVPPLFWLGSSTLPCSSVTYACQHDEEVDQKCKDSCGWCSTTTTTSWIETTSAKATTQKKTDWLETKIAQVTGCGRRRGMGYCFTRRRRLF